MKNATISTTFSSPRKFKLTKTPFKILVSPKHSSTLPSKSKHSKQSTNNSDMFLKLQQNSLKNSTSLNYTHHNYLHTQTDKSKVLKLSLWDKEYINYQKKDTTLLYQTLSLFYKANPLYHPKEKEIEKYNAILEKQSKYRTFLQEAATRADNRILKNFINSDKREQGTILYNSISKTKSRFDFSLFNEKNQKDFQSDLNIDASTLNTIKNGDLTTDYYRKIIREKNQQEQLSRDEIMKITKKVFDKKRNRIALENKLSELYDNKNKDANTFNDKKNKIKMKIINLQHQYEQQQKQINKMSETEQLKQRTRITAENNILESKIKKLVNEYDDKTKIFFAQKEQLLKEIDLARKEENYFKKISHEFLKDQQQYFLDILKKGYDVRNEGLVWVVKNLLELDTNLEYHHFPKFLDHQQCDFLIQLADITLEETQLKIVLKAVKSKQRQIQSDETLAHFNKIMDYVENNSNKVTDVVRFDPLSLEQYKLRQNEDNTMKDRLFEMFNNIYEKHGEAFKYTNEKRMEEMKLEKVQRQIKETLLDKGANKGDEKFNEILCFLQRNEQSMEFLEIILNIRARLEYLTNLKEKIKNEQLMRFRISNLSNQRFLNAKHSLQHDLIFSALFGSNVQL